MSVTEVPAPLLAPFPYEGSKRRSACLIWQALGADTTTRYIEPFAGSAAVALARPGGGRGIEVLNDSSPHLANVWRSVRIAPRDVARAMPVGVSELDLEAVHLALVESAERLRTELALDPRHCQPEMAAWWIWGRCAWLGPEWATGEGPWNRETVAAGSYRRRARGEGSATGGIKRKLPLLNRPRGVLRDVDVEGWLCDLSERLHRPGTIITCGDWRRVLTPSILATERCSVLLDGPYPDCEAGIYADEGAWWDTLDWALAHGDRPKLRIVLCGLALPGTEVLEACGWQAVPLGAGKGWGTGVTQNRGLERAWMSPSCAKVEP